MGSNFANDLADLDINLKDAIAMHLRGNHYPPVPLSMVEPCIEAIDACNEDDSGRLITLPEGVLWRGETSAPAYAIAESHHLDAWLDHSWDCECQECVFTDEE